MTGFMVTTQVGKARTKECRRITSMTPKRVELDTGVYARCEFSFSYGTVVIDLEFNVVADMLFSVFHDYMPTMDAVHRFMVSNPNTSANMLAEIQVKKLPASEGTAAMREEKSGWVIERGDSDASRPFYWGGACGWTYDNLCAVRFARKEDAESVDTTLRWERERKGFQPHNNRIAEHGWS